MFVYIAACWVIVALVVACSAPPPPGARSKCWNRRTQVVRDRDRFRHLPRHLQHRGDAPHLLRRERACSTTSTSRRRWRACRRGSASSRSEAADEIVRHCHVESIRLGQAEDARPSASAIRSSGACSSSSALCDDGLGEWCHWGATTQDITDTATVLQIRDALELVEERPAGDRRRRSPASRGAIATRRWRGAATCSRRCRSPSATRCAVLLAGFQRHLRAAAASCARACWWASSAAPPARSPRSAPTGSRCRRG